MFGNKFAHYFAGCYLLFSLPCHAGPFAPAAGNSGSTAIAASDPAIVAWASGYGDYVAGANVDAQFQTPLRALNSAGNSDGNALGFIYDTVSLGEGGRITLSFERPIRNGEGADFAVFENSFSDNFLELAWVEVSSNGNDFVRFANYSLTTSTTGPFGNIDPSNISGYGGKYRGGYGTPFDLETLAGHPALDLENIRYVRLIDIVGDGSAYDDMPTPAGPNPIYDPYPSAGSAGFDLDAVAVIHQSLALSEVNVPLPPGALLLLAGMLLSAAASTTASRKKNNHPLNLNLEQ